MLTVIYIAPNKKEAKRIETKLSSEGLLVKLRSLSTSQKKRSGSFEILVPESEAKEALEIINLA
ncbi:MAG: glutamate decarboxylase [Clostridiales bacterium]|nr:glutamate decarboxylase [Clostridiales bacterium]MCF8021652.1 glutamate decarboxylase [Clostridiales bacterium]